MNEVVLNNDLVAQTAGANSTSPLVMLFEKFTGGYGDTGSSFLETLSHWWDIYSILAILVSILFFVGFIYSKLRYDQLATLEQEALRHAEEAWARRHEKKGTKSSRWDIIQQRASENNPESWRVAIIEADIFLDETLTDAGYVGQSVGEKLKSANPNSFTTVQDAWEAHKVRNEIAHAGSDFVLTKKTAQATLVQFERVFREFGVI